MKRYTPCSLAMQRGRLGYGPGVAFTWQLVDNVCQHPRSHTRHRVPGAWSVMRGSGREGFPAKTGRVAAASVNPWCEGADCETGELKRDGLGTEECR